MKDTLNIALIQYNIDWHDPEANFSKIGKYLKTGRISADLIVLPEMFCCGFTNQPENLPRNLNELVLEWMTAQTNEHNAAIMGSFPYREGETFYNRMVCMDPDGNLTYYDKRHLFSFSDENKHYSPGNIRKNITVNGWNLFPAICYDIRFPVWCRNDLKFDVMVVVANWPAVRRFAWETLLTARAIENQCYVLAVNRIGTDAYGITYEGRSLVISPEGRTLASLPVNEEGIILHTLQRNSLSVFREKYPFLQDRDKFSLK
jgi:predicted amidohydrolase